MEKIRPSNVIWGIIDNYNDLFTGNFRTQYTKQIYDKKVIFARLIFFISFTQNIINWYIENTEYTTLKDFINVELSSIYCPDTIPLHMCLFFAKVTKSEGLRITYDSKTLKIPLLNNEKVHYVKGLDIFMNLILNPGVSFSVCNKDFWKENTYITITKVDLPFTITRTLPDNITTIKYMIILCSNDVACPSDAIHEDKTYSFFDNIRMKYPNVNIKIKQKLTCFMIKCSSDILPFSSGIIWDFLKELQDKCSKSKLLCRTYYISNKS